MTKLLTTRSYNSRRGDGILLIQVTDRVLVSWLYWGSWADIVTQPPPIRQSWCRFQRMSLVVCLQFLNVLRQHKYCWCSHTWWRWCGAKFCVGGILCGRGYYCLLQRWMCIFSDNLLGVSWKIGQSHLVGRPLARGQYMWELPGNYPVFTTVLVIYHYVERIWRIIVTRYFCITYTAMNKYYPRETVIIHIQ